MMMKPTKVLVRMTTSPTTSATKLSRSSSTSPAILPPNCDVMEVHVQALPGPGGDGIIKVDNDVGDTAFPDVFLHPTVFNPNKVAGKIGLFCKTKKHFQFQLQNKNQMGVLVVMRIMCFFLAQNLIKT
jgi:hypothetical protein